MPHVPVLEEQEPLLEAATCSPGSPDDPDRVHPVASSSAPPCGPNTTAQASCRICLQEEVDGLVQPCNCSGSMAWAHHQCIQRWINEKHDKTCEVCRQQFRGSFEEPPPRPPPPPLIAQLQVDNADNRIVLLMDPVTGAVSRMVVPPDGELPDPGDERYDVGWQVEAAEPEPSSWRNIAICTAASAVVALICLFAFLSTAAHQGEAGAGSGAWLMRIVLLTAWLCVRSIRPVYRSTRRHYVEQLPADLEAGRQ